MMACLTKGAADGCAASPACTPQKHNLFFSQPSFLDVKLQLIFFSWLWTAADPTAAWMHGLKHTGLLQCLQLGEHCNGNRRTGTA